MVELRVALRVVVEQAEALLEPEELPEGEAAPDAVRVPEEQREGELDMELERHREGDTVGERVALEGAEAETLPVPFAAPLAVPPLVRVREAEPEEFSDESALSEVLKVLVMESVRVRARVVVGETLMLGVDVPALELVRDTVEQGLRERVTAGLTLGGEEDVP